MIYLIGGPARCGKSTLAARVRKEINGQVLSGDALTEMLRKNLEPGWVPDIFDHDMAPIGDMLDYRSKIDRLRRRDEAMWQFFFEYIRTSMEDAPSDDVLLEGDIWPDYLEGFGYLHKAVFLIDTSPDQVVRLKQIRDRDGSGNNWMRPSRMTICLIGHSLMPKEAYDIVNFVSNGDIHILISPSWVYKVPRMPLLDTCWGKRYNKGTDRT